MTGRARRGRPHDLRSSPQSPMHTASGLRVGGAAAAGPPNRTRSRRTGVGGRARATRSHARYDAPDDAHAAARDACAPPGGVVPAHHDLKYDPMGAELRPIREALFAGAGDDVAALLRLARSVRRTSGARRCRATRPCCCRRTLVAQRPAGGVMRHIPVWRRAGRFRSSAMGAPVSRLPIGRLPPPWLRQTYPNCDCPTAGLVPVVLRGHDRAPHERRCCARCARDLAAECGLRLGIRPGGPLW